MAFQLKGKDISASFVVFLVALPLCMGVAVASKADVISGLMAGVIGGVVVGFLSGYSISVSGAAAGLITLVESAFSDLKVLTPEHYLEAFALAVILAGVIQMILGLIKLGRIADFIPVSVIKGMLAAIGLILILKQIPHLVGYDKDFEGDEDFIQSDGHNTLSELFFSFEQLTLGAVVIGVFGLFILIAWESNWIKSKSWSQWIPGSLVVVLMGVLINGLAGNGMSHLIIGQEHMVQVPVLSQSGSVMDSINGLCGQFHFPNFKFISSLVVWVIAIKIALIASIETLLSIEAGDKIDPEKRVSPANRELIAQGTGNFLGGLVGALPITAVIVRTSANVSGGAKTSTSTILHGVWLLFFVLFAPQLINLIPNASLAAILIFIGYKLAKPSLFMEQWKLGKSNFYPFIITVLAILFSDLLIGIGIGLLLGFYFVIRSNYHKAFNLVRENENVLIRFHHQASFLNKSLLKQKLNTIHSGDCVLLDFVNCTYLDNDILDMIQDFLIHAELHQIAVEMNFLNSSQEKSLLKLNQTKPS